MTSRQTAILGFLLIGAAALLLQVYALRESSRIPPLGEVFTSLMATRYGRVAVMLAWWWMGWHFLAR